VSFLSSGGWRERSDSIGHKVWALFVREVAEAGK
jgi:hypothetical protein